jgi:hypothetical protein
MSHTAVLQSSSTSLETSGTFSARDDNETVIPEHCSGAGMCGSVLLRERVIDRRYGVPSTGTYATRQRVTGPASQLSLCAPRCAGQIAPSGSSSAASHGLELRSEGPQRRVRWPARRRGAS